MSVLGATPPPHESLQEPAEVRDSHQTVSVAASRAVWSESVDELLSRLASRAHGLTGVEAERRRRRDHKAAGPDVSAARLFFRQLSSPITLILIAAAALSLLIGQGTEALLIGVIVLISALLGFFQEHTAARAVARLLASVEVRARVVRDGIGRDVPFAEVVPGDVVLLGCGDLVPADCRLLEARDLSLDESSLTGESFPSDKRAGVVAADATLSTRSNLAYGGTHVVTGSGRAVVYAVGDATQLGQVAERLRSRAPETDFERGIRRFGHLLVELTLLLTLTIFAVNVYLARPVVESLLFAVALAVGLTPQLLPAIISVNLAQGARRMARRRVIVKRLAAIENFGSMTVLCADKTGTVTETRAELSASLDADGATSERVRTLAAINAALHSGFPNPIDDALRVFAPVVAKLDELAYDFTRKRQSVLVELDGGSRLLTKGAVDAVLAVCRDAEQAGATVPIADVRAKVLAQAQALGEAGERAIAVAIRSLASRRDVVVADETELTFVGLVAFAAPLKADAVATVARLGTLGVRLKLLTGDGRYVSSSVATRLGLNPKVVTGSDLDDTSDSALPVVVGDIDVFAELEPRHKERIVRALRLGGAVVGHLGDGINDAAALHAADVGISVYGAADVAREAADIVLLDHDLGVLIDGVLGGRRTFANTLKYVFMATSANFGNMFSMAGASIFLPFLPLLPKQVLLTNLLTDLPEMTIGSDNVDDEWIARPQRWDIAAVRRFMLVFGVLSSLFDYATLGLLRGGLGRGAVAFRTGWFLESVVSASLVVLVIRSRRPLLRSRPGRWLMVATVAVIALTALLPWTALGRLFGFAPPAPLCIAAIGGIVVLYVLAAEQTKRWFYRSQGGK